MRIRIPVFGRVFPRNIDFYIFTEILAPFFGGMLFFIFVFLMFQVLRLAEMLIAHGTSPMLLAKMTWYLIVSFLPMVLPVSFLICVLMGFGRLSADSELVAMKAGGISLSRMTVPVVSFAIVVSIVSFYLNTEWAPRGDLALRILVIKLGNTKAVTAIKEGTFTTGFFDLLVFAEKVDPKTNRMEKMFIYDEREQKEPLVVVAKKGQIIPVKTDTEMGASAILEMTTGNIHRNEITTQQYQRIDFNLYRLFLNVLEGDDFVRPKPKMIPYDELRKQIREEPGQTDRWRELMIELWRRYSLAMAPLVFIPIGIGLGTYRTRAVRAGAAFISLIILVFYWGSQAGMLSLAQRGLVPPWAAMEMPNFLLLVVGFIFYKRATW